MMSSQSLKVLEGSGERQRFVDPLARCSKYDVLSDIRGMGQHWRKPQYKRSRQISAGVALERFLTVCAVAAKGRCGYR